MEVKLSPLKLLDFAIITCNYKFVPHEKSPVNIEKLHSSYAIDIDFSSPIEDEEDKNIFRLFVKTQINEKGENQKDGHEIFVEGIGIFQMENREKMSGQDKLSLEIHSSLQICIGAIRSFIITLTSSVPVAKYILPAIDVNYLVLKKIASAKEVKSAKKTSTKQKK